MFLLIQLWRPGPWFISVLALFFSWQNSHIMGEQECLLWSSRVSGHCWRKAALSQLSKHLVPASQSAPHCLVTYISLITLLASPHRTMSILLWSLHSSSLQYAPVAPDAGFLQSLGWKLPTRNFYSFDHEQLHVYPLWTIPSVSIPTIWKLVLYLTERWIWVSEIPMTIRCYNEHIIRMASSWLWFILILHKSWCP